MPLQDHFHPPLSLRRHWHAFHNAWATYIASDLNRRLPAGYFAEANVQYGIEIEVGTFDETRKDSSKEDGSTPSKAIEDWDAPAPAQTIPISVATDVVEIQVFSSKEGPTLTGAIKLVSPANKDRPTHRDAFISKCEMYLQHGVGLVIVDVVTDRLANMHNELLARLGGGSVPHMDADLYAGSYRPVQRNGQAYLDIWQEKLAVGQPLLTIPLWLRGGLSLPVDLDGTYERTCLEQRVTGNGMVS